MSLLAPWRSGCGRARSTAVLERHHLSPPHWGLERLRAAGWTPVPFNTDTFLGIVVPSHYTVCHEYAPIGHRVRLLAQKYGC